jgi:hypothetical protein
MLTSLVFDTLCDENTVTYSLLKLNKNNIYIYIYFWSSSNILIVTIIIQFNLINPSNISY